MTTAKSNKKAREKPSDSPCHKTKSVITIAVPKKSNAKTKSRFETAIFFFF
ncbi:MAG: hypothetical protein L6V88_11800 [Anaerotruncus sp.]|nr:MAG: hypothetical protein L6V88_11800 [Anaerotruncus sp.]